LVPSLIGVFVILIANGFYDVFMDRLQTDEAPTTSEASQPKKKAQKAKS
jgi:hypothetical protein